MRRRIWIYGLVLLVLIVVAPAIVLVEFATRRPRLIESRRDGSIAIEAADGVMLVASLYPAQGAEDRRCILLQHGVGSRRLDMPGFVRDFPKAGFAVLSVDSRGHGESGGERVTYGALEREDMRRWFAYLGGREECRDGIYGLGLSMGAAILLQTLPDVPQVKAAVAESPFASFREIGRDRVGQIMPLLGWLRVPIVEVGFAYADPRIGLDLRRVSPMDVAPRIEQPVMLIHGTADRNIDIRHSEMVLPRLKRGRLFKVEGAGHVGCYGRDPQRYVSEVAAFFQ